jgi:hypothetical protein
MVRQIRTSMGRGFLLLPQASGMAAKSRSFTPAKDAGVKDDNLLALDISCACCSRLG